MSTIVSLPLGSLGLELEPAKRPGHIGCRVRKWRTESTLSTSVCPGMEIIEVDDIPVDDLEFRDIVQLLKVSKTRKISLLKSDAYTSSSSARSEPRKAEPFIHDQIRSRSEDKEIVQGLFIAGTSPLRGVNMYEELFGTHTMVEKLSIANNRDEKLSMGVDVLLREDAGDEEAETQETSLCYSESSGHEEEEYDEHIVSRNGSLIDMDVDDRDELLRKMKSEICILKRNARGSDGQLSLMRFRMEKLKAAEDLKQTSVPEDADGLNQLTSMVDFPIDSWLPNYQYWIIHMYKMRPTFDSILGQTASISEHEANEDLISLQKELEIQKRISERLEARLRDWADEQILSQKQMACDDVKSIDALSVKEVVPPSSSLTDVDVARASSPGVSDGERQSGTASGAYTHVPYEIPLVDPSPLLQRRKQPEGIRKYVDMNTPNLGSVEEKRVTPILDKLLGGKGKLGLQRHDVQNKQALLRSSGSNIKEITESATSSACYKPPALSTTNLTEKMLRGSCDKENFANTSDSSIQIIYNSSPANHQNRSTSSSSMQSTGTSFRGELSRLQKGNKTPVIVKCPANDFDRIKLFLPLQKTP